MKIELHYYECEHNGDLARYENAVARFGAKQLSAVCNIGDTGVIVIEVEGSDFEAFKTAFEASDANDFCSGFVLLG